MDMRKESFISGLRGGAPGKIMLQVPVSLLLACHHAANHGSPSRAHCRDLWEGILWTRKKQRYHAKKLQRATQNLLRKVTDVIPKQCRHSGLRKLQVNTRNIPFNQHPQKKETKSLWVRNVSTSALYFIQVHHKGICFRQGKVDIQQNHCLLQCLYYPCTLGT